MTDQLNTMTPGLRAGDKLVHFEVQEQLASGGMGIVWRAHDRLLGRHVAIKQIAEAAAVDEIFREKFRHEAELQKRVSQSHPNIVDIIDFVDDPRGLFIVMEYVEGLSLDRVLAQMEGPIEPLKALVVLRDVALALAAIHQARIVHRDLKPANILVPSSEGVKVCDFGLAALMNEQETLELGTTQYLAPELLAGGVVDGRADVYSLGMIAYEMLAGRAAFQQAFKAIVRDQRNAAMRWMKWHTNTKVTAPPLTQINPAVPAVLSEVVERLMAKDANQRMTVEQLLETIKRHFSRGAQPPPPPPGVAVSPAAASAPARAVAAPRAVSAPAAASAAPPTAPLPEKKSRRLLYIVGGVTLLNVLILLGVFWWWPRYQESQRLETQMVEADRQFAKARDQFKVGQFEQSLPVLQQLAETWGEHPRLGVGARGYALAAEARLLMEQADQKIAEGDHAAAMETYQQAGQVIRAAQNLELPGEAKQLTSDVNATSDEIATRRGFVQQALKIDSAIKAGQFEDAKRLHRQLRDASKVLTPTEQNEMANLGVRIQGQEAQADIIEADEHAESLITSGKLLEARNYLAKSIEKLGRDPRLIKREAEAIRRIGLENALREMAEAEASGNLPAAAAALARANELESTPERAMELKKLRARIAFAEGQYLESQGQPAAAGAKYQEAVALDPEHSQAMERLRDLKMAGEKSTILASAETAFAAQDFEQASQLFRNALALAPDPQTQSRLNEANVRMHVKIADAALKQGDLPAARAALEQALRVNADDSQASSLMKSLEVRAKFLEMVEQADKLRTEFQYGPSKSMYQKAIDLARSAGIDARDVTQRKLDTEFEHLIAHARSAMEVNLWAQARALLMTARNMRPDDARLAELLAEVEKNMKGSGK